MHGKRHLVRGVAAVTLVLSSLVAPAAAAPARHDAVPVKVDPRYQMPGYSFRSRDDLALDAHVTVLLRHGLARHVETGGAPRVPLQPAAVHLHVRVLLALHVADADLGDGGETRDLVVARGPAPGAVHPVGVE